jgi:hypothetical protein
MFPRNISRESAKVWSGLWMFNGLLSAYFDVLQMYRCWPKNWVVSASHSQFLAGDSYFTAHSSESDWLKHGHALQTIPRPEVWVLKRSSFMSFRMPQALVPDIAILPEIPHFRYSESSTNGWQICRCRVPLGTPMTPGTCLTWKQEHGPPLKVFHWQQGCIGKGSLCECFITSEHTKYENLTYSAGSPACVPC